MLKRIFLPNLLFLLLVQSHCLSQEFRVDTSFTAEQLVRQVLVDPQSSGALSFSHIEHVGAISSIGHFAYTGIGGDLPGRGLLLGTGNVKEAEGPNIRNNSCIHYRMGDSLLQKEANGKTYDASILAFDFISFTDSISFAFVFASEEYMEYVDKGVSDVFGFYCRKKGERHWKNLAVLPNSAIPVTVDLINRGKNSDYYMDNASFKRLFKQASKVSPLLIERAQLLQFDGFTKGIATGVKLEPFVPYEFHIAIADVGDARYDSWVMLVGGSFKSPGNVGAPTREQIKAFLHPFEKVLVDSSSVDKLEISTVLHFDYNSSTLKEESYPFLERLSKILKFSNYKMQILGYADSRGDEAYNLNLSEERAKEVMRFLLEKGVRKKKMTAKGMGEDALEENFQSARKVVFQLEYPDKNQPNNSL